MDATTRKLGQDDTGAVEIWGNEANGELAPFVMEWRADGRPVPKVTVYLPEHLLKMAEAETRRAARLRWLTLALALGAMFGTMVLYAIRYLLLHG